MVSLKGGVMTAAVEVVQTMLKVADLRPKLHSSGFLSKLVSHPQLVDLSLSSRGLSFSLFKDLRFKSQ